MTKETNTELLNQVNTFSDDAAALSNSAIDLAEKIANSTVATEQVITTGVDPFIFGITTFVLACFVGYYVVWKVTPALHTPLMSVTNAISSIIILGAIIALGPNEWGLSGTFGFFAVILASINIFGGFVVTQRMLQMFKKR